MNILVFTPILFSSQAESLMLELGGQSGMLRVIFMGLVMWATVCFAFAAEPPNFSGTWKADLAKCDFGMETMPESLVYRVEQKKLSLNVGRVKQEDGKETKTARTFEARLDGTTLLVEYHATYQGYDLEISEKWSLSDNGKALTVLRSISAGGGGTDQRLVFPKESSR